MEYFRVGRVYLSVWTKVSSVMRFLLWQFYGKFNGQCCAFVGPAYRLAMKRKLFRKSAHPKTSIY